MPELQLKSKNRLKDVIKDQNVIALCFLTFNDIFYKV